MTKEQAVTRVREAMELVAFPEDSKARLTQVIGLMAENEETLATLSADLSAYEETMDCNYKEMLTALADMSEPLGVHRSEACLVFYLTLLDALRAHYREAGLADSIFLDTVQDLRYKLGETKTVHGIHGISESSAANWYNSMFRTNTRCFERLHFVFGKFGFACECDGVSLTHESPVLHVHIPKTGTKLDHDKVLESYRLAAEHYRKDFGENPIVFTCRSWMLWPRNLELLKPDANMALFYHDFQNVESGEYDDYSLLWRIFDRIYTGDVNQLPTDSSLRRAYADIVRRGEKMGWGRGVFIYR